MDFVIYIAAAVFIVFMMSEYVLPSLPKKDIHPADKYRIVTADLRRIEHTLISTKLSSSDAAELIEAAGYAANQGKSLREMMKSLAISERELIRQMTVREDNHDTP